VRRERALRPRLSDRQRDLRRRGARPVVDQAGRRARTAAGHRAGDPAARRGTGHGALHSQSPGIMTAMLALLLATLIPVAGTIVNSTTAYSTSFRITNRSAHR